MTFDEKSAVNAWVKARYDALMQEGKHGHYETLFRVVHEALARYGGAPPQEDPARPRPRWYSAYPRRTRHE